MKEYDAQTLKKVQNTELEILKDFDALCRKYDLKYFGFAGTGIGAIRHKGFIPWDDDIDLGMPRKDFELFLKYAKEELSDKYTILNCEENENYPLMTTRFLMKNTKFKEYALKDIDYESGIFLDLYPFDNLSDNSMKRWIQLRKCWLLSKLLILRSIPFPVLAFKGIKAKVVHALCWCIHKIMVIFNVSKKKLYEKCKKESVKYNHLETAYMDFPCDTKIMQNALKREDVFPLQELLFEDIMITFPKNLEVQLANSYGDFMTLPPVEKRKNHYPYELEFKN